MVDFRVSRVLPTARPAGPVSRENSEALGLLAQSTQRVADQFSEFYEAEAARQRELLTAEMQLEWARRYEDTARDAGDGYAARMLHDFDQYRAERMETAPRRGREDLDQAFDLYRMRLSDRVERAEIAARERRAAAAASAARATARQALEAEVRIATNGLVREPTEEALTRLQAQYPDHAQDLVRTYDAARMIEDPAAVMQDIADGRRDDVYTPSQMIDLREAGARAAERDAREREAARAAALDDIEAAVSEEAAYIEANGFAPTDSFAANPEALDLALGDLIADPEERQQARAAVEEQYAQSRAIAAAATATPMEMDDELNRLVARVQEPGNTEADQADLNRYAQAVQRRNESIATDSAGHVMRINDEVAAYFGAVENAETPEDAEIAASQYRAAARAEYDRLGVPPELRRTLPVGSAQGLVASLMQEGTDTLPARLNEVVRTWGPGVVPELTEAGLPEVASVAARYADNPGLATTILGLAGTTRTDLAQGLPTATVQDMDAALEGELSDYREAFESGDQTGAARATFAAHQSVAERLILNRIRQGDSVTSAVRTVMEQMFPETPLVSSRMRVLIPETANVQTVEGALDRALSEDMVRAFAPEPLVDPTFPEFANEELMIRAALDGVWLNNSAGDGAVLAIDLGGFFMPVRNRAGGYYEVSYADPRALYNALRPSLPPPAPGDETRGPVGLDLGADLQVMP